MPTTDEKLDAILGLLQEGVRSAPDPQRRMKLSIIRGDTYGADARGVIVTRGGVVAWPTDLSAYTWTLEAAKCPDCDTGEAIAFDVEVVATTGDAQGVRLVADADVTAGFAVGRHAWAIVGSSGDTQWTLAKGIAIVEARTT